VKRALALVLLAAAGAAVWMWREDVPLPSPRLRLDEPDAAVAAELPSVPAPPPALAGRALDIALFGEPARWYAAGPVAPALPSDDAADGDPRRAVAEAARAASLTVLYDADLARAASEVAVQTARLGAPPPEAALPFLLHASGAPEVTAAVFVTHATSDDDGPLNDTVRRALAQPIPGAGPLRIGVGEAASPGDRFTRHVAVLAVRRDWDMDRAPTWVAAGGTWAATFRVPATWTALVAHTLGADGRIASVPVVRDGDNVSLSIAAPGDAGAIQVAIDGTGPRGPGKLLQLTVWTGEPPRETTVTTADADPPGLDEDSGSARALSLLVADRAAVGAPPLTPDPALAAIARGHSLDMRAGGFFGHRSPTTGDVVDRMAAARYRATSSGENLARNDSLAEAQAALMASVGHRANIVDPRFTHVGVAAVRVDGDWLVTQVFARPVEALPADAASRIASRINGERATRGLSPLSVRTELAAIAARHAPAVAASGVSGATDRVSNDIRPLVARAAVVSTHQVGELAEIQLPDAALDGAMTELGAAAVQDVDTGRVGAVVVIAR
jgi:uncharacterized protein YkwD